MKFTSKVAAIGASAALIVGLTAGSAAALDINYAPGLPAPAPGVPNNPPSPTTVGGGVVLVASSVADNTTLRVMKKDASDKMGDSPKIRAKVGAVVKLDAAGLTPGVQYVVSIKPVGGEYATLGSTIGTAGGSVLPAFRAGQKGSYIIAITNPTTGQTQYIKVVVR